jgi:hypothetical protein
MSKKSLSLAFTLAVVLSTAALAAPRTHQAPTQDPQQQDVTVIERVIRAVKKIVHTFDQPIVPVPDAPPTTTT